MTTNHTPGRLQAFTQYAEPELRDEAGNLVAVVHRYTHANARRLAACWNACEGMSTELLENIVLLGETMLTRFLARNRVEQTLIADRLRFMQERDALQATVNAVNKALGNQQMQHFIEKHGEPAPIVAQRDQLLHALQLAQGVAERVIAATGFDESKVSDWRPVVNAAIQAAAPVQGQQQPASRITSTNICGTRSEEKCNWVDIEP